MSALLLAVACEAIEPVPAPSIEDAQGLLHEAEMLAQAGKWDELCELGAGNCERLLDDAGRPAPAALPDVVGTRVQSATTGRHGGVVLEMCGVRDSGERYYTEVLVFRDDGDLRAIEPIYWSGYVIAEDGQAGLRIGTSADEDCPG